MNNGLELALFSGPSCHLCHEARNIIMSVLPAGIRLKEISIADDPQWQVRYGTAIPVLAIMGSEGVVVEEKAWPFTQGQVKRMIARFNLSEPAP